jgi:biopolymer transport protein ExbD
MAMSTSTADGDVMVEMNTTPLIDVMLVLLTLLIITLPIQTHAVKLDMPAPNQTPPTVIPETVELGVDFDGTITWNGATVDRATMDAYLQDAAKKDPQPEIHVSPNRLAKYDAVAKVLADAQRLGETHIGFTGIDQYN